MSNHIDVEEALKYIFNKEANSNENHQKLADNKLIKIVMKLLDVHIKYFYNKYYIQTNDNSIYCFSDNETNCFQTLNQFFSSIPNHPYKIKNETISSIQSKKSAVYVIYCIIKEPNYSDHRNSIEELQKNFKTLVILLLVSNSSQSLSKLEGFHGNVINLQVNLDEIVNNNFNQESLNELKKIIK
ncbi:hypothetical protein DICPUDRAFT_153397 [Dictyostelium purpureum]|uniref:Uncharacterized protein n=1 Tax=Dictyostelium purpureum TaxID=5786 RepID=F0ZNT1_DICPU|nr:uncharacterized protein DICPUDRAFT_153397 [Dictyostelium purpureum]EGC34408.1 hypothetical protein DICPUDRAFT_153397 [Dictyostelium purpureum]|eukprot:XP_003289082.1 hypothetical protein DICPUDRAFT_153397 [Dictyostelium purpureum]